MRDQYGVVQLVVDSDNNFFSKCEETKLESVVTVIGEVIKRSEDLINEKLPTGNIEVSIKNFIIESMSDIYLCQYQENMILVKNKD